MELLRNSGVKRSFWEFGGVAALGCAGGFFLGVPTGLFAILLCAALFALFFLSTKERYRKIAALSTQIDGVLHGRYRLKPGEEEEGELSILEDEIYKMTLCLREQADQLEADKAYLSRSLADIAHQLRTPLTSVQLLLPRIQCAGSGEEQGQLLGELQGMLHRTDWLVSALLKIARLDSGTVQFRRETVKLSALLEKACQPLQIPMELREQALILHMQAQAQYVGDFAWSAEALGNILKNCMEHTPVGGEITVTAQENPLYTAITIEDNGPGISAMDLPHVFKRFYKGAQSEKSSVGIGLALSKQIIEAQGGTLQAEPSTKGARFSLRFYHSII